MADAQQDIAVERIDAISNNQLQSEVIDLEIDSGVDNSSESSVTSHDGRNNSNIFSSTESLDDVSPTFDSTDSCIKTHCQDFIESERNIVQVRWDMPADLRFRLREDAIESKSPAILAISEEECDHKYMVENDDVDLNSLPPYFQDLWLDGRQMSADFEVPLDKKPSWYCDEKFKRGQKFAQTHLFCINYAETVSLFLIFAINSALEPLVFTEKSDTPFRACQRYLSTLTRVMSWYEEDPWEDASGSRRNLQTVRAMHRNVQQKIMESSPEERKRKCRLSSDKPAWCPSQSFLLDDFRAACPVPVPGTCPAMGTRGLTVNQLDMAVTQFAFVGLVVTYPNKFGIHFATDEDLEGFLHVWQTLGYLLGIQDKFNFCNVGLEEVRRRTHDFINMTLKPSLRNVTGDWEHMCRCLVQGIAFYVPGFEFDTSLKYLCNILKVHTPRLSKSLTMWQSFMVRAVDFTFNVICRIPGAVGFYNRLMLRAIRRAQKASPQLLSKWEKTQFPYMKKPEPVKAV